MYLSFFVSFSELWNSRLDWFRQSVTQGWSLRRETGTPVRPAELEPWAVIWYTAGDRGKDKDEDSFNGGSTSGRGLIRRGDSFRGEHRDAWQGKGGNGPKMADCRFLHRFAAHWSSRNQAK